MPFDTRPDLHYRRIGDDFLFLDLAADRYFLLQGPVAESFGRFVAGEADCADLDRLAKRRLLVETEAGAAFPSRVVPVARSSLLDGPLPSAAIATAASSIWAQARARRALVRHSLLAIVTDLAAAGRDVDEADIALCRKVAAAFVRARHYAPAADQCLVRGLAMKRMLLRRRCAASLVFGVTMPFAAHCWVQVGEMVLTDPLDFILPFEPILAV